MGTVGLNFGNLSSGTGFDVASTVTSILAISSSIETPWKNQLTSLQAQDTAFSTIGSDLSTLSTSLSSLTSFDGVLYSKLGSSSDTNSLSLSSASSSAVAGSHTVIIHTLATTSSNYSSQITTASDVLSGSLTIGVGSASKTVTVDSSSNTLQSLATAINSGAYGVTASVVQSSTGYRLSLVSNTPGTAGQISITSNLADTTNSNAAVTFSQGQPGADATLNVDGLETTSASNTVTGAIPGVTFQLLAASGSTDTPIQVQITNDNSSVETAFQSLVTAYNAVVADIKTQEGKDSNGNAEPLFGNTTLATIQTQLSQALLGGSPSGKINNLAQLGLTIGTDGKLTLDNTTLGSALNSNFSDIVGFLQNTGSFGQNLSSALNSLGGASTGAIALAEAQNTAQEATLNADISKEETLIATQKISLTAELNKANQILQQIPSQLDEINQIYSAETGYNTATTG